jgi:hypothetical protein
MAVLGRSERQTATVWTVVNTTVRELAPRSRSETRRLRITLLQALNQLLRRGLVRRSGWGKARSTVSAARMPMTNRDQDEHGPRRQYTRVPPGPSSAPVNVCS